MDKFDFDGIGDVGSLIALMEPVIFGQESVQEQSMSRCSCTLGLSKSMLAEDAPPNRLDRAKYEIMEMVDAALSFALVGCWQCKCIVSIDEDVDFFQMILNNTTWNRLVVEDTNGSTVKGLEYS